MKNYYVAYTIIDNYGLTGSGYLYPFKYQEINSSNFEEFRLSVQVEVCRKNGSVGVVTILSWQEVREV